MLQYTQQLLDITKDQCILFVSLFNGKRGTIFTSMCTYIWTIFSLKIYVFGPSDTKYQGNKLKTTMFSLRRQHT